MATEFDSQLIESVTVRRNRVTDALLFGPNPTERRWRATARQFLFSIVAAALIAAICVAIAFVADLISTRAQQDQQRQSTSAPAPTHRQPVRGATPDAQSPERTGS